MGDEIVGTAIKQNEKIISIVPRHDVDNLVKKIIKIRSIRNTLDYFIYNLEKLNDYKSDLEARLKEFHPKITEDFLGNDFNEIKELYDICKLIIGSFTLLIISGLII